MATATTAEELFAQLGSLFSPLVTQLQGLNAATAGLIGGLGQGTLGLASFGTALLGVVPGFGALSAALSAATVKVGEFYAGLAEKAATGLQSIGSFGSSLGSAAGALVGPFGQIASAIGPFVGALNPAVMQAFQYTLRNLMATIGVALVPVIEVFRGAMQSLTVTLYPAMQALAPILRNIADVVVGNLIPIIGILVDLFVTLAPVIEFVTELMSAVADVNRVLMTVFRTVIQTLLQFVSSFFGGVDLKDIASQFRHAIQEVAKSLVLLAAYLSKFLSSLGYQNNFIDNLLKNLGGLQGRGEQAVAAPQNAGLKGFEQIGKDIAVAAFTAQQAGTGKKETNDFLAELVEAVKGARADQTDAVEKMRQILDNLTKQWFGKSLSDIEKDIEAFLQPIIEWVNNPTQKSVETYKRLRDDHPAEVGLILGAPGQLALDAAAAVYEAYNR